MKCTMILSPAVDDYPEVECENVAVALVEGTPACSICAEACRTEGGLAITPLADPPAAEEGKS